MAKRRKSSLSRRTNIDKLRNQLEEKMYDVAVYLVNERDLTYSQVRQNFLISVEDVIEMLDIQYPEISSNGDYDNEWR
jgi:hypothetical protein